jgi:transposase, IS5 family
VIKAGKTPEGWEKQPAKNAQKDKDARWPKKNDESFYSYKNHVGVDKAYKLIRKRDATDAARARQSGACSDPPTAPAAPKVTASSLFEATEAGAFTGHLVLLELGGIAAFQNVDETGGLRQTK